MANFRLDRILFWIVVVAYLGIKIPLSYLALTHLDGLGNSAAKLDTPLVIALAFAVGARLNDAGINRWAGIGATLFITMILPAILMFGYLMAFPKPAGAVYSKQEFFDVFTTVGVVPTILLAALLIWAGTRPTKPEPPVPAGGK